VALQIEYEDISGVVHPAAYARISKIIIENPAGGQKNVSIDVCIYASKAARDAGKSPVWGPQGYQVQKPAAVQPEAKEGESVPVVVMECAVDPNKATVADVYAWLKTQEKYAGGMDV
jgi:hypothetical protein